MTVVVPSAGRSLRALVRRGLRDQRRAPLAWGIPLGGFSALIVAIYPSVRRSLQDAVASYPSGLKKAFNVSDLGTVAAYLDAEVFSLILPLAVGYFAVRCTVRALAGAEERGYLDVLLAAPLSRGRLVAGSYLVTALVTAAVLAVTAVIAWVAGVLAGAGLDLGAVMGGAAAAWALTLFFAGVSTAANGVLRSPGQVTAAGMGTLLAMYVIDLVGRVADVGWVRWASAFRYYGAPVKDGANAGWIALLLGAGVALVALGAVVLVRRDIRSR